MIYDALMMYLDRKQIPQQIHRNTTLQIMPRYKSVAIEAVTVTQGIS